MKIIDFLFGLNLWNSYGSDEKTYPAVMDFGGTLQFMIVMAIMEPIISHFFKKIGKYLMIRNQGLQWYEDNMDRLDNFQRRSYPLIMHIILSFSAYLSFRNEIWWFWNTWILGIIFPRHKKYGFHVKLYLNLNCADYLYKTIVLFIKAFLYGKKKDFTEMLFHHVLSLVLLTYAFLSGYAEFAILVLYISNLTDIFTYSARMVNDVKWRIPSFILLPLMMIAWCVNRLIINPYLLINAGWMGYNYIVFDAYSSHPLSGLILIKLLLALYILHTYWIYGLFKITYYTITKGVNSHVDHMAYNKKKDNIKLQNNEKVDSVV